LGNFFRSFIRASSFLRKEISEILRQPRLVATLVLGPFLILLIFGFGYSNQPRTLRTLFVAQTNSPLNAQEIQNYRGALGVQIAFVGISSNQEDALNQLQRGQVDLVVVEPVDATSSIKNNQQAVFTFYHHEIDPLQVSYVGYMGWLFAGVVNQQVLQSFAVQGQAEAVNLQVTLKEAHANVAAMRVALQSGNEALAQQKQQELASNVDAISQGVGISLGLLDSLQQTNGATGANTDPAQSTLTDLHQNTNQLSDSTLNTNEQLARLDKADKDITDLES
jgi:ABC-2 type transport system permease protein